MNSKQKTVLKRLTGSKRYDGNGTLESRRIITSVFLPYGCGVGDEALLLLCAAVDTETMAYLECRL